jgi:hypothetical protein
MKYGFSMLIAAMICLSLCTYAQIPSARIPDGLGVNIHFTDPQPGEMEMLAAAGFKFIRMDYQWAGIEKTRGQYDFAPWDRLLAACEKVGIRPMYILDYSNPLYDKNESPRSDEGIAAFARWAAASVVHFRGHHIIWESYNEPNGFWKPVPEVGAMIKLALATGKAIKAAAPDEIYVGPALAGTGTDWLEPCYKSGLLEYWDAVTVHPYGETNPETRNFAPMQQMIDRYTPPGKHIPLCTGEWGFTSAHVSAQTQGKYLAREFLNNLSQHIPLSIWYDWHDDGTDPHNGEHRFGTVAHEYHAGRDPVFDPKPAYHAAQTLTHQLEGFSFAMQVKLPKPEDYLLLFSDGDKIRAAAWTTAKDSHTVELPAAAGRFTVTSVFGERLPDADSTNALTLELTDGPKYLIPSHETDAAWRDLIAHNSK